MARDFTGQNIDTIRDSQVYNVATLVEIFNDVEDGIQDVFTESGSGTMAAGEHTPIRADGGAGSKRGSVWRHNSGLAHSIHETKIEQTDDNLIWDIAGNGNGRDLYIDSLSPDGCVRALSTPYDGGSPHKMSPAVKFRVSDENGGASAYCYFAYLDAQADNYYLSRLDASGFTSVATVSYASTSGTVYLIEARYDGDSIECYANDQLIISYTNTNNIFASTTVIGAAFIGSGVPSQAQNANANLDFFEFDPTLRFSDRPYDLAEVRLYDEFDETTDLISHTPNTDKYGNGWVADGTEYFDTSATGDGYAYWNRIITSWSANSGVMSNIYCSDGYVQGNLECVDDSTSYRTTALRFRYDDASSVGLIAWINSQNNTVNLDEESPNDTVTNVASASVTITSGTNYDVKATFSGTTIKVYVDGTLYITQTSTVGQYGGWVGVGPRITWYTGATATDGKINSFRAGPLVHYDNLLPERGVGPLSLTGVPGGGIFQPSGTSVSIVNQGQFATVADALNYFRNALVRVRLIFIDDTETSDDVVTMFSGRVTNINWSSSAVSLTCSSTVVEDFVAFPRDVINIGTYPNAPLNNMGKAVPVAFGLFDKEIASNQTSDAEVPLAPMLAPTILTDVFDRRYVIQGSNSEFISNASIGYQNPSPIWYDSSNHILMRRGAGAGYLQSVDTQDNNGFDDDANNKIISLDPIRAGSTDTFASSWKNITDFTGDTKLTLDDGADVLSILFQGIGKRGVLSAISFSTTCQAASGSSTLDFEMFEGGVSLETGVIANTTSRAFQTTALTLSNYLEWPIADLRLDIKLDGSAISTDVWLVVLNLSYLEIESSKVESAPCFARVNGYKDQAIRYQDGALVSSSLEVLRNPAKQFQAIMRDRYMGMGLKEARMDLTKATTAESATSADLFDFSITEYNATREASREWMQRFLRQANLAAWIGHDNKWALNSYSTAAVPVEFFNKQQNIAVGNSGATADKQRDTLRVLPPSPFYNEFFLRYAYCHPYQEYTSSIAATGRYLITGVTGDLDATGLIFTDANATFQTDFIYAGMKVYVRTAHEAMTAEVLTIDSVDSETQVTLTSAGDTDIEGIEYYVGSFLDADCVESYLKYGEIVPFPQDRSELKFIIDDTTASTYLSDKISYHAYMKGRIELKTFFNAIHLEPRDFAYVDHDFLPRSTQKTDEGNTLAVSIDNSTTSVTFTGTAPADGTLWVIESEIIQVSSTAAQVATVVRAYGGSEAAAHDGSVTAITIYEILTKWEVLELHWDVSTTTPIRVVLREV
jgi:hypothetical protein